jgi:hypothetical protein
VPRRVRVHTEGAGAVLGVQRLCPERQHLLLGRVQVLDGQVQMELLRGVGGGPLRGYETGGGLEGQRRSAGGPEVYPVPLALDAAAEDTGVETGERAGVRTVQYDGSEFGDGYGFLLEAGLPVEAGNQ